MTKLNLTVSLRNRIRKCLIERKYDPLQKANQAAQSALAAEVLTSQLPPEEWKRMEALPEGWLPQIGSVRLSDPASDYANSYEEVKLAYPARVPASLLGKTVKQATMSEELWKRWEGLASEAKTLKAERAATDREVEAMLESFRTVRALVEGWPEVEPVVREIVGDGARPKQLPALTHLNAALDLPPETAEAA